MTEENVPTETTDTVSVFDGAPLVEQPLPELVEYKNDPVTGNWNDPETSHEEVEADEELVDDVDDEDDEDDGEFPDDTSADTGVISTTSDQ